MTQEIPWLDFPLVRLPVPTEPDTIGVARISGSTLHQLYRAVRRTAIWQAWAHLAGTLPPIPNTSVIKPGVPHGAFGSSEHPVACFKGLKRPHCSEEDGNSVLAYVFKPSHTLAWHSSMVCVAKVVKAPPDTVFVVYVDPRETLQDGAEPVIGTITGWEFLPTDPEVPALPNKFGTRYAEELWRR